MPGLSNSDINVIDTDNSTSILLAPFATFTGVWRDVTGYSSVSVSCKSDVGSQFAGLQVEWSTNGTTLDLASQQFTFDPLVISQDGFRVHATVAARFFRIKYENANIGQTFFALTTLLRKGTPSATVRTIDPANTFTTNLDVLTTQSILSGVGRANSEQVQLPLMDDVNIGEGDGPFLFVSPRPTREENIIRFAIPVSLTPVLLNPTVGTLERATFLSITNDVKRGNLYVRLETNTGLSPTNYDYKIFPGETWEDPGSFGSVYGGNIFGVWDEAYIHSPTIQLGKARYVVNYYGQKGGKMDIHNSQFGADIEHKTLDTGTPAWAVKPGPDAIPAIPFVPGTPIATETFEGTLWIEVPFDSGDWEVTSSTSHGGTKCFRGKTGIAAATTQFSILDFFGSQQLSFWYKMPDIVTGIVNDLFEVKIDGIPAFSQNQAVSDWTYVSIPLAFAFQIDFIFHKNFPIIDNTDTVFLDDVVLGGLDIPGVPGSPAHPYVYSPMYLCGEDHRLLVSPALITVPLVPESVVDTQNFETDPITGSGDWLLTTSSPHTGSRCLRSKVITNSQTTDWTFSIPGGANTIRFWARVSSESGFDLFRVYKDSVDPANLLFQQSGTANVWAQHTLDLTGATQVIFRYSKDSSDSAGLDAAFIDDIEWIIAAIPASEVCSPLHLDANGGLAVSFPHLNCVTDSVEICNDAGSPISVQGTIALDGPTLAALEVTDLGPTTLAALETITVLQGTSPWVVAGTVNIGSITFPFVYPEDSHHTSGDPGAFVLGVRNDTGGSLVNTDLDYAPLQLDSKGSLRVTSRADKRTGCYLAATPSIALTTAADAATGGKFWLTNTSSTIQIRLIEARYTCLINSLIDLGSASPSVAMERMTFTGTPSGTLIAAGKRDSTDPGSTGTFRSTNAGMVITSGASLRSWFPATQLSVGGILAVNATAIVPVEQIFKPRDESGDIILRQNEGIVFRQASAGAITEARLIQIDIVWEEYSV